MNQPFIDLPSQVTVVEITTYSLIYLVLGLVSAFLFRLFIEKKRISLAHYIYIIITWPIPVLIVFTGLFDWLMGKLGKIKI